MEMIALEDVPVTAKPEKGGKAPTTCAETADAGNLSITQCKEAMCYFLMGRLIGK